MINPLDLANSPPGDWQHASTDMTGVGPDSLDGAHHHNDSLHGASNLYGDSPDPLGSPLNPTDPMQTSSPVHLDRWQPHSWDYTASSWHGAPHAVSQMDSTQWPDHTVHQSLSSMGPASDPVTPWSHAQNLTDNSHLSLASATHLSFSSCGNITTDIYGHKVFMDGWEVGSYNGNSFYWNNGNLAGTWNCQTHHAYGPNGKDLGYAGSWDTAAQLIYHQQY